MDQQRPPEQPAANGRSPGKDAVQSGGASLYLVLGILFTAFVMRAPMTSLSAILNIISEAFSLSAAAAGTLTTIPTILFALTAVCAPMLLKKWSSNTLLLLGTLSICLGIPLRSFCGTPGLYAGTSLIGLGIGFSNVLLPKVIKQHFPDRIELFTALYISSMTLFAALGSGFSNPLASALGWRWSLLLWAVIALPAVLAWTVCRKRVSWEDAPAQDSLPMGVILKTPMAWKLTLCMGTQALAYYSMLAWLPTILQGKGMAPDMAGYSHLIEQVAGMVSAFAIPILIRKTKDNRFVHILSCAAFLAGLLLLLFWPKQGWLQILMLVLLGWGTGVGLAYTVTVMSLRAASPEEVVSLSAMVQTGGYLMSALGPTLLGLLLDWTGSQNAQVFALILFVLGFLVFGTMVALRPGKSRGIL